MKRVLTKIQKFKQKHQDQLNAVNLLEIHSSDSEEEVNRNKNKVVKYSVPKRVSLEGLPFEIKVMILQQIPDVPTLKSLVRASPAYHAVYVSGRYAILSSVIYHDMDPSGLENALPICLAWNLSLKTQESIDHARNVILKDYQVSMDERWKADDFDLGTVSGMAQGHLVAHSCARQQMLDPPPISPVPGQNDLLRPTTKEQRDQVHRVLYLIKFFHMIIESNWRLLGLPAPTDADVTDWV